MISDKRQLHRLRVEVVVDNSATTALRQKPRPVHAFWRRYCYEGEVYWLFDDFDAFTNEIERSKKAIMKTSFAAIPMQVQALFGILKARFGDDSRETHAVVTSRLYCAQCGVAYKEQLLPLLLLPYECMPKIANQCPKCHSSELLYLYRA
jgi:hypothetical protein